MPTNEALPLGRLLSATVRLSDDVVLRVFPAEAVVFDLHSGEYHALNPVAGRFLEVLGGAMSVRDGLALLQAEFSDQDPTAIEADVYAFCLDLVERGLIELGGDS